MRDMTISEPPKSDEPNPENKTYRTSVSNREAFLPETASLHPSTEKLRHALPKVLPPATCSHLSPRSCPSPIGSWQRQTGCAGQPDSEGGNPINIITPPPFHSPSPSEKINSPIPIPECHLCNVGMNHIVGLGVWLVPKACDDFRSWFVFVTLDCFRCWCWVLVALGVGIKMLSNTISRPI